MAKPRANPHPPGSAENVLFARWKRATANAALLQRKADEIATEAGAHQARADHYAKALAALGHPVDAPKLLEGPKA